jgi:serine/threonine protein kinase/tetratricopeptide (TPR) repeat protein
MPAQLPFDDSLAQRLPLPLAQLYRRAHNAKTAIESHLTAFSLWEASLKLLASVALVEYAQRGRLEPALQDVLQNLARPSLGHWWDFTRRLLPLLADSGDNPFGKLRDLVLGRSRDDLPHLAGLDAALREALDAHQSARAAVRCTELFDRLVRYRNLVLLGHAAPGQLPPSFHERMAAALLAGTAELLRHLDPLAGRRLVYVGEVRQTGGVWLAQRFDLSMGAVQRVAALELPREELARVPDGDRLYLEGPAADTVARPLHPLLLYDAEAEAVLFLNSRRGKKRTEYLCYTTGRTAERPDLAPEQRELLARALGMEVSAQQVQGLEEQLEKEESSPADGAAEPVGLRRNLGEFELLSELGRGGMGIVYRAWQPSLRRQVAVKKLLVAGDERTEARFQREIRALGRVEHPNLVKVFTSGSDGQEWFYAMELVEGAPLSKVHERLQASGSGGGSVDWPTWLGAVSTVCAEVRRSEKPLGDAGQPRPAAPAPPRAADGEVEATTAAVASPGGNYIRQVVELVRQVALAAHALHDEGVVHRDINPNNVLVSADGRQAVLMDLGLAQLADEEEGRVTRTGHFVGTLRYSSPQQVLAAARVDRRADVYSLGATLWELLALRPLFEATEKTPTPELMEKVQREEPQRLQSACPRVGRDLEAVVHKCLEKDAGKRYATAAELARDLERWLTGQPVRARPVRGWERAWKWARRRPAPAALILLAALALLGAVAGVAAFAWQADRERRAAQEHARKEAGLRKTTDDKRDEADREKKKAEETLARAKDAAQRAGEEAARARQEARRADEQAAEARRQAYWAQIGRADAQLLLGDNKAAAGVLEGISLEERGWEHRHLSRRLEGTPLTLRGHTGEVHSVSYSPDGSRIASASDDSTVKVWDARTGAEVLSLPGHTRKVLSVCYSPDGTRLASASDDKTVKVWDARTGAEVLSLRGHTDSVYSVSYSPDGSRLASGGGEWNKPGEVKVWDARSGAEVLSLRGHTGAVLSVSYSPDGARLVSRDGSGQTLVWDAATGKRLPDEVVPQRLLADNVSPDGKTLAMLEGNLVRLWRRLPPPYGYDPWAEDHDRRTALAPAWHATDAEAAENASDWFVAAFHRAWLAEHTPWDAGAWKQLEEDCTKLGAFGLARTACDRLLQRDPGLAPILLQRARIRLRNHDTCGSWADLVRGIFLAIQDHPDWDDFADAAAQRGAEAADEGDWPYAVGQCTLARAWQPHNAWALHHLAWARLAGGDEDGYRTTCQLLRTRFGNLEGNRIPLTLSVLLGRGQAPLTPGLLLAEWAVQQDAANRAAAIVSTACLLPARGIDPNALAALAARAVAIHPDSATDCGIYGAALYRAGRHTEAVKVLEEAVCLNGQGGCNWQKLFLAMTYHQLGQPDKARERFNKDRLDDKADWGQRLLYQRLRQEAAELLQRNVKPSR